MTIISTQRSNQRSSAINDNGFIGFGSGGFDDDDLDITNDEVDNFLEGGINHEIIKGRDCNDSLSGGAGDVILDGQSKNDVKEKDKLFDDAGNDLLRASFGFDELTGRST